MDIIVADNSTMYLICVKDYLIGSKTTDNCDQSNPGKNDTVISERVDVLRGAVHHVGVLAQDQQDERARNAGQ